MRPLVRTEQLKMRMPKEVKNMIKAKADELNLTITAYVETLVKKDHKESLLTKKELIEEAGKQE